MNSTIADKPKDRGKPPSTLFIILKGFVLLVVLAATFFLGLLLGIDSAFGKRELYRKQIGEETLVVSFDLRGTLTVQAQPPVWKLQFRDYWKSTAFTDLFLKPEGVYELRCADGTKITFTRPEVTSPSRAN